MVRAKSASHDVRKRKRNNWGYLKAISCKGETVYAVVFCGHHFDGLTIFTMIKSNALETASRKMEK